MTGPDLPGRAEGRRRSRRPCTTTGHRLSETGTAGTEREKTAGLHGRTQWDGRYSDALPAGGGGTPLLFLQQEVPRFPDSAAQLHICGHGQHRRNNVRPTAARPSRTRRPDRHPGPGRRQRRHRPLQHRTTPRHPAPPTASPSPPRIHVRTQKKQDNGGPAHPNTHTRPASGELPVPQSGRAASSLGRQRGTRPFHRSRHSPPDPGPADSRDERSNCGRPQLNTTRTTPCRRARMGHSSRGGYSPISSRTARRTLPASRQQRPPAEPDSRTSSRGKTIPHRQGPLPACRHPHPPETRRRQRQGPT